MNDILTSRDRGGQSANPCYCAILLPALKRWVEASPAGISELQPGWLEEFCAARDALTEIAGKVTDERNDSTRENVPDVWRRVGTAANRRRLEMGRSKILLNCLCAASSKALDKMRRRVAP